MCCTISYQKCVCFVFLVVLAVLSCSGFRIDNLAMTDVSKRNSGLLEALLVGNAAHHRLRHRRQMLEAPAARGGNGAPRRRLHCPEVDASWKAYMADAVAVASIDSRSSRCKGTCTVQFKIHRWLKNPPPYEDELIRLNFRTDRGPAYCENDDPANNRPYFLVKTNGEQSKRYILFLRTDGPHNYGAAYAPELNRTRTFKTVMKVNGPQFRPKPLRLELVPRNEGRKRLRLQCKVRGFPIPILTWKVNNTTLHPNNRIRITQKKRKSTLVIRNVVEADWGRYECVARSVDGKSSHVFHTISRPKEATSRPKETRPTEKPGINSTVSDSDRKPCNDSMKMNYCLNGGTCFYTESMNEYSCECPNGFVGQQCEKKSSDQFSMYRQTPLSTCKVGLYTRYDNC